MRGIIVGMDSTHLRFRHASSYHDTCLCKQRASASVTTLIYLSEGYALLLAQCCFRVLLSLTVPQSESHAIGVVRIVVVQRARSVDVALVVGIRGVRGTQPPVVGIFKSRPI